MPFNLPADFDFDKISDFLQKIAALDFPVDLDADESASTLIHGLIEAVAKEEKNLTEIQGLLNSLETELNKEKHNDDAVFQAARGLLQQLFDAVKPQERLASVAKSLEVSKENFPAMARDQKLVKQLRRAVPTGKTKARDVDLDEYDPSAYAGRQSMIAMIKFSKELLDSYKEAIKQSFENICVEMLKNSCFADDNRNDTVDSFLFVLENPLLSEFAQLPACREALEGLKSCENPQAIKEAIAKILELMQSVTGQPELSDELFKISSELSIWFLLNSESLDDLLKEVITKKDVTVRELALTGACLGLLLEADAFKFLENIILEGDEENQYVVLASYIRELLFSFNQVVQPGKVYYSQLLYLESMMQCFEIEAGVEDDLAGYFISLGNLYAITGRVLLRQEGDDQLLSASYFSDGVDADKASQLVNLMLTHAEALPGRLEKLKKGDKLLELVGTTYNHFFDFLTQLILALDLLKSKNLLNEYVPKFQSCIKAFLTDAVLADDHIVKFRGVIIRKGIEASLLLTFAIDNFNLFQELLERRKVSEFMKEDPLLRTVLNQFDPATKEKSRAVRCKRNDEDKAQQNVLDAYVLMLKLLPSLKDKSLGDSILFSAPAADYFAQKMLAMVGMKEIPLKIRFAVGHDQYKPLLHAEMCANAAEFMCRLMKKLGDVEKEARYALEYGFYCCLKWDATQAEKQSKFQGATATNSDLAARIQLPSDPSSMPGSANPFVLSLSETLENNKPIVPFLTMSSFDAVFFKFQPSRSSEALKTMARFKIYYYQAVITKMRTLNTYALPLMPEDLKQAIVCLEESLMRYAVNPTSGDSMTRSVYSFLSNQQCASIVFEASTLSVAGSAMMADVVQRFRSAVKDFPGQERIRASLGVAVGDAPASPGQSQLFLRNTGSKASGLLTAFLQVKQGEG